jgi:hypothetical protein
MNDDDFLIAAADAVRAHDPRALQAAIRHSAAPRERTKQLFREELPMLLNAPDLLWLLQEVTSPEQFAANRDQMIAALFDDLCRNGYVPGIDFSVLEDDDAGKVVHVKPAAWNDMQQHLSPRALQHYRCFIRLPEG